MAELPARETWTKAGEGASAEVWAIDEARVLKLFRAGVNDVPVALEYQAGDWAADQGLPVPRPLARVVVDDRAGIVFQRASGADMLSVIRRVPGRMWALVGQLARLHAQVHEKPGNAALPWQIDVLRHRIVRSRAGAAAIEAALQRIDGLETGSCLVHGDFHPGNLLLSDAGTTIIDWAQAAVGTAAADVARTDMLLRFGGGGGGGVLAGAITARWYRLCYARHSSLRSAAIDPWRLPVAVAWHRGQLGPIEARVERWIAGLMAHK
ncbi:MAG: aminoglycoside phosphotransferase family protein [Pseudomonadota bacterium]|uniref:aminoglycoside phosphotransferase family protein n=1 Tax=Sphingobium sp. TaxID=1912891 RepID=UPI002E1CA41E